MHDALPHEDLNSPDEKAELLRGALGRLAVLDRIAQSTRSLTDATDVMAVTARILGEALGATRCAYADVESDSNHFTIRSDWAVDGVASSAGAYSLELFGPQATSLLRRGEFLVVHDVDAELGDDGGARMFNAIGIKALICAGLVKEGRLVAMMAVHQSAPRRWAASEVVVVGEVVDRCWAHIERVRDAAALREQDQRKDEFLATLAHELRNPVAPLRYANAILKRGGDPSQQAQAREIIDRQTEHLTRLIDDLLDVSRINRGLIELRKEIIPIDVVLHHAVEASTPAIEAGRHDLQVRLDTADAMVDADHDRLVQVVTNLLNNAAKYTLDGGHIQLRSWVDSHHVNIQVTDNGVGIPLEDQGKLFQLFMQLPQTAKRTQGGLGIGLSLVRRLTEKHGGTVTLHSAGLDQGSTFTVSLPLARRDVLPVDPSPAAAGSHPSGRGRVLIVDDNADGLEALLELLRMTGFDARGAEDGPQALEVASSWQPHLVLLDLGLPVMDGYEVAARLRANPALAGMRVVALTGWGAQRDKERTGAAGFDGHLTKPVDPDHLMDSLARWLAPA